MNIIATDPRRLLLGFAGFLGGSLLALVLA